MPLGTKSKKAFQASTILSITINAIRESEERSEYTGRIEGLAGKILTFSLIYNISLDALEVLARMGEAARMPAKTTSRVLNRAVKDRYVLKVMDENGGTLKLSPEEADLFFFIPLNMAIGLLKGKRATTGSFHIPMLAEEEMRHFPNPQDLQDYVDSLNQ